MKPAIAGNITQLLRDSIAFQGKSHIKEQVAALHKIAVAEGRRAGSR